MRRDTGHPRMTYSRTEVEASPDLKLAWRQGRLDARCLSCGATMAATSKCYRCRGELEYREHLPGSDPRGPSRTAAPIQWCQQGEARRPDPSNPRTGIPRAEWLAKARARKAAREATPTINAR